MVSNPLDALAHLAYKVSKFSRERVIGMAGILDTARFRTFLAPPRRVSVGGVWGLVPWGRRASMVPRVRRDHGRGGKGDRRRVQFRDVDAVDQHRRLGVQVEARGRVADANRHVNPVVDRRYREVSRPGCTDHGGRQDEVAVAFVGHPVVVAVITGTSGNTQFVVQAVLVAALTRTENYFDFQL